MCAAQFRPTEDCFLQEDWTILPYWPSQYVIGFLLVLGGGASFVQRLLLTGCRANVSKVFHRCPSTEL